MILDCHSERSAESPYFALAQSPISTKTLAAIRPNTRGEHHDEQANFAVGLIETQGFLAAFEASHVIASPSKGGLAPLPR
jgi:hypothetical protein